ncbi:MAG: hypothetical protein IKX40_05275 [Thermoguttaceae bacterium]|nr:hypothetical protein [Thermoguttaceae bacterium]
MKTKPFRTLSIVTASVFALTLLVCSESNAQGAPSKAKAAVAEAVETTEAAEDVSWDDNKGPGPKPFADRPRPGDKRGPFADRPNHDRPEGRPPRPSMDRPPMGGPQEGFRKPGSGRPEGRPEAPGSERKHGDMLPPPPPTGPFQNWDQLEKSDPELFKLLKLDAELDRTTRQLTMQYRQTVDADSKAEIGAQLAETVAKHFDVRQKRRALELERLEKELNRMKELFEKRNDSRDKIIEQRLKELKGEEESLF